jgi:YVTN family beta-propeller protein
MGYIGGRAVTFTPDSKYALVSIEALSVVKVVDLDTLKVTRDIPVGAGPRGLTVDAGDNTLYVTNFSRTHAMMKASPPYGPNTLTSVDLDSAPLDRPEGEFNYHELVVGYGPCSVALFDLGTLPARRSNVSETATTA